MGEPIFDLLEFGRRTPPARAVLGKDDRVLAESQRSAQRSVWNEEDTTIEEFDG